MTVRRNDRTMKKKKRIETTNQRYKTSYDYIYFVDEFWGEFHDTDDLKEKFDHFGNIITCMFMYFVSKYDQENYQKIVNEEEGGLSDE
jgi:hypothetical protein